MSKGPRKGPKKGGSNRSVTAVTLVTLGVQIDQFAKLELCTNQGQEVYRVNQYPKTSEVIATITLRLTKVKHTAPLSSFLSTANNGVKRDT